MSDQNAGQALSHTQIVESGPFPSPEPLPESISGPLEITIPAPPSEPVSDGGRDPVTGKFGPRNKFGKGNALGRKAKALRQAVYQAVTERDMRRIARRMIREALSGDVQAAKLVWGQVLGPGQSLDIITAVGKLEGIVFKQKGIRP